jgi:hypothetical protein
MPVHCGSFQFSQPCYSFQYRLPYGTTAEAGKTDYTGEPCGTFPHTEPCGNYQYAQYCPEQYHHTLCRPYEYHCTTNFICSTFQFAETAGQQTGAVPETAQKPSAPPLPPVPPAELSVHDKGKNEDSKDKKE